MATSRKDIIQINLLLLPITYIPSLASTLCGYSGVSFQLVTDQFSVNCSWFDEPVM